MPILETCCGYDLKIATKVIAIFSLISSLLSMIIIGIALMFLVPLGDAIEDIKFNYPSNELNSVQFIDVNIKNGFVHDAFDYHDDDQIYNDFDNIEYDTKIADMLALIDVPLTIMTALLASMMVFLVIDIIVCNILIYGIRRNRRCMLLPWLCFRWFSVVVDVILIFPFIAECVALGIPASVFVTFAIISLISMVIPLYFLLVVTSQYQAMGLTSRENEIGMTAIQFKC